MTTMATKVKVDMLDVDSSTAGSHHTRTHATLFISINIHMEKNTNVNTDKHASERMVTNTMHVWRVVTRTNPHTHTHTHSLSVDQS